MPLIDELVEPTCNTPGIFWHRGSERFLSYVGYHEITATDENGFTSKKRILSTQPSRVCRRAAGYALLALIVSAALLRTISAYWQVM